jgi:hypothetical protein
MPMAPEQRVSRLGALNAVTIDGALEQGVSDQLTRILSHGH